MKLQGIFISFEGIEGCGKTSQVALLAATLRKRGYEVTETREPGGTTIGKHIRQLVLSSEDPLVLKAELLLMLADRAQHVTEIIIPALKNNQIVICDRFSDSTIAYQGFGRGLHVETLHKMNNFASFSIVPNITFLLDIAVADGLERARQRRGTNSVDRFEKLDEAFHERVHQGFLQIAEADQKRIRKIDALRSQEEIHQEIVAILSNLDSTH